MLTREQIKAARAMLDWSQKDLAAACADLSEPTIKLIEAGKVRSTAATMSDIQNTFERCGIEFIEGGVRFRSDTLTVLEKKSPSDNLAFRLLDDMYYTCRDNRADVLHSFIDNSLSPPEILKKEELIRALGVKFRHLIRHGDTNLHYPAAEYRWLPDGTYINSPTVVYGDKFAIAVPGDENGLNEKIVIIHNKTIAQVKRMEFDIIWNNSAPPKTAKGKKT